ncbi:hypothetical protein AVEN_35396-1 [Araneus ventricosus]|uniref:Uncharacterized protein n=1 Tax=Araneus ventricosus TaxID=182803 RepID=A0A4Y2RX69_ARAVE|nr:hypothetical protein AVEN_35396-1 [Araneus ventricosus]
MDKTGLDRPGSSLRTQSRFSVSLNTSLSGSNPIRTTLVIVITRYCKSPRGQVELPSRSPDLTPLYSFSRGTTSHWSKRRRSGPDTLVLISLEAQQAIGQSEEDLDLTPLYLYL